MNKKQFEELISVLKEVKASLDALKAQPQYVFVSQPPLTVVPQPDYTGGFPIITCGTGSISSDSCTTADSNLTGIQCFNNV
jgi:hypothetical protein